tara:strand:- start:3185 stop:3340 length:156 start_codon:yes stop_codon:yes gene_type:complete
MGQQVRTIANRSFSSGKHTINFDASSLASGTYFYTIKSGQFTETRKMTLIK